MFQTIVIVIISSIIIYLIFDKKGIKADDVKLFFKNIGERIKEKSSTVINETKASFNSIKRKTSENSVNVPSVIETSTNDNESANDSSNVGEETRAESMHNSGKNKKRVLIIVLILLTILVIVFTIPFLLDFVWDVLDSDGIIILIYLTLFIFLMTKRWFRRLMLVALILFICIAPFAYKKTMLDYDGKYATDRLVYTEEYGFCMLITYYPNYQSGNAKGFAVTNIPFETLFYVQANQYGNDTADSKDLLDSYQMLATFGDNTLVDSLAKILLDSKISTRSIQIGKYGNYIAIKFEDYNSLNSSSDSVAYDNGDFSTQSLELEPTRSSSEDRIRERVATMGGMRELKPARSITLMNTLMEIFFCIVIIVIIAQLISIVVMVLTEIVKLQKKKHINKTDKL
ncbi:MAG: hypothetical protein J5798_03210 [Spirochaetaceae bacterium]|nr:hypothetical protein [Spirochaetaceae bacterium]